MPNDQSALIAFRQTRLMLMHRFPFFGNLALGLVSEETYDDSPVMATDGVHIYYHKDKFKILTKEERLFVMLHEIMHIVCLHHTRMPKNADFEIWNISGDFVINLLISELDNITMPPYGLYDVSYKDMSIEAVYHILKQELSGNKKEQSDSDSQQQSNSDSQQQSNSDSQQQSDSDSQEQSNSDSQQQSDSDSQQQSNSKLSDLVERSKLSGVILHSANEVREEEQKLNSSMVMLNRLIEKNPQIQKSKKSNIPQTIKKEIISKSQIGLPWHKILADFITKNAQSDWDWEEPDQVYLQYDIIMPNLQSNTANEFAIAIDVSGSINWKLLQIFIDETKAILSDIDYSKVHIIYCHSEVVQYDEFEKQDEIKLYRTESGGTAFAPVFEFVAEKGLNLSGLIYFTDLDCYSEDHGIAPEYPVLWCCFDPTWMKNYGGVEKAKQYLPNFGQILIMEN